MRSIEDWLSAYGESHQNGTNKLIHWICVPSIMFSIVGLLNSIPFLADVTYLGWGTLMVAFTLVFYFRLSLAIFLGFIPIAFLLVWGNEALASALPFAHWKTSLSIFVIAWIGQFLGHKIEGKKPSFFDDLQFLLIGPAWLMSFIYKKLGIKYA